MTRDRLDWGCDALGLTLRWDDDTAPWVAHMHTPHVDARPAPGLGSVQVLTTASGHRYANGRLSHTAFGERARLASTREEHDGDSRTLLVGVADGGLRAQWRLRVREGVAAVTSTVTVVNDGTAPVALRAVPSWAGHLGAGTVPHRDAWMLQHADSDWMAESRWSSTPLDATELPDIDPPPFRAPRRGSRAVVSTGTWSTGSHLPVGVLANAEAGVAWGWQIAHNGPWRWEVGDDGDDLYLAASGPTDADHQWLRVLAPGERFTSVPVTVALGADATDVFGILTDHRRTTRLPRPDSTRMPVVFNDYMNTLVGDPTTARLLPLVDAAADVGAEAFVIDAGWYDDTGDWWDSVGAWQPSTVRFPRGLREVTDRIRSHGMVAGLWLEPESVGVRSALAATLPDEAFITRAGLRIVEHDRYHLDFRNRVAIDHLDAVVDRLVADFGIGYFKCDANIDPHTGSDRGVDSPGDGLLRHNRAYIAWVEGLLSRHPALILENCASGGMRADPASTRAFALQSTSDQEDPLRYPPIAAAAPALMPPEQAANWAYPQPEMTHEQQVFTLVTGLTGHLYLSGHLDRMCGTQRSLVREAVDAAKTLRADTRLAHPFWPLGLPGWDAPVVALGLHTPLRMRLSVWSRTGDPTPVRLPLPVVGTAAAVLFPVHTPGWTIALCDDGRTLVAANRTGAPSARLIDVTVR